MSLGRSGNGSVLSLAGTGGVSTASLGRTGGGTLASLGETEGDSLAILGGTGGAVESLGGTGGGDSVVSLFGTGGDVVVSSVCTEFGAAGLLDEGCERSGLTTSSAVSRTLGAILSKSQSTVGSAICLTDEMSMNDRSGKICGLVMRNKCVAVKVKE